MSTPRRRKPATRYPAINLLTEMPAGPGGVRILAERLGIDRLAVNRWKTGQIMLPIKMADQYAIRLGHHPSHFWPTWFDDALNDN